VQCVRIVRTGPMFRLQCRMPELPAAVAEAVAVVVKAVAAVAVATVAALAQCRLVRLPLPLTQNRSGFFYSGTVFQLTGQGESPTYVHMSK